MIRAMFSSATGMNAQQTMIDNTANNLANVNTNGFKRGHVDFQDLLYINQRTPGSEIIQGQQVPTGTQVGSGVRIAGITKIFTPGSLVSTTNPLDVSIDGDGFFQVTTVNGELRYTRDGALKLNSTGNLTTSDGFLLNPQITIPTDAKSISISADGTVLVETAGSTTQTPVGQLTLARFVNPAGLSAEGRNLFAETASSGSPLIAAPGQNGIGLLKSGMLERANVDMVAELVNLILAQRAFEFNTRAIRTADNMLSETSQLVR